MKSIKQPERCSTGCLRYRNEGWKIYDDNMYRESDRNELDMYDDDIYKPIEQRKRKTEAGMSGYEFGVGITRAGNEVGWALIGAILGCLLFWALR